MNRKCLRSEILCPNCFKKKLMIAVTDNDKEMWCDFCGTQFILTGKNTVRFK